ncbi:Crp/Fnr family transcriptional regulator [Helicovermis profundi]|uniref:Cyclic nucleotide-binding domain-containing protein n=1 Tax=Helicovermis profundi TaxID=3065157 RepID=A0AAU9EPJ2_9FIRM|nr:hypothetical protein HLPR_23900 [Clostridia bacterium S502]
MNITVVIPTYWGRSKDEKWKEGDAVYDHPTYLNGEDTLGRTLESMKTLENNQFKLIIPVCPTSDEVEEEAEERVMEIVKKADLSFPTYLFTQKNLREIKKLLKEKGLSERTNSLLNLKGYSNVRNMCLYSSHILGSDVTILIDDDEVFEKPKYIDMAVEYIGKRIYGKGIYGVAGYYLNKYNEFYDDVDIVPWMTYWNRFGSKTKAFDKIIGCDPRIKVTPFAFGGAMVIHKNLLQIVPFDPDVTRGEDIDYLINAKMFGFDFFLDNKLSIKHLPPKKNHPIWKRFREDIYRFLYEQTKIRSQYEVNNMTKVTSKDFEPYPGDFLSDDLEDKIYKTNVLLALEYLSDGDVEGCKESLKNIYLSKYEAIPKKDPFTEYRRKQKDWVELINVTINERMNVRRIIEGNNLTRIEYKIDSEKYKNISKRVIIDNLKKFDDFKQFDDDEMKIFSTITNMRAYNESGVIFKEGQTDLELFLVMSGCIRILEHNNKKEEIVLANVCTGGVIGETFMVKTMYNVTGVANEFTEVMVLKKADLMKLIQTNPVLGNKLLLVFLDRLYYKLNRSNIQYKEKIIQEESLSEIE